MQSAKKFGETLQTYMRACSEENQKMNRYEFFQKVLTQLSEIQTALNTLRDAIKEEIKNEQH